IYLNRRLVLNLNPLLKILLLLFIDILFYTEQENRYLYNTIDKEIIRIYIMKKKIEAELYSLAKDLLEVKDSRSTTEWKDITQNLYDKLCILEHLESQLYISEKSIGSKKNEQDEKVNQESDNNQISITSQIEEFEQETQDIFFPEDIDSPSPEKKVTEENMIAEKGNETPSEAIIPESNTPTPRRTAEELQRFASTYKQTPVFGRKTSEVEVSEKATSFKESSLPTSTPKSLNDSLNRGLHIALNDRIAFINNLFAGSTQDFNRVLSQINTLDDFDAVQSFLEYQIMPDYNHWEGKEEFSERFINIIEKKFS